jgi:hypothetical protein
MKPLMPQTGKITYLCLCARAHEGVSACLCVSACVCVGVSSEARACAFASLALFIQHATRMCRFVGGFSCSTKIFFNYLTNCTIFGKKLLNIKCVF